MNILRLVCYYKCTQDFDLTVNNLQASEGSCKLDNITLASRCAEDEEITTSCLGVACNKWKEGIISRSIPLVSAHVTPLRDFLKVLTNVYICTYYHRTKGF